MILLYAASVCDPTHVGAQACAQHLWVRLSGILRPARAVGRPAAHLSYRFIVLVARRDFPREIVVDPRQPLCQDSEVVLDLCLLLLIGGDRPVQLLALLAQLLNAVDQLRVVVLQGRALLRHGSTSKGRALAARPLLH